MTTITQKNSLSFWRVLKQASLIYFNSWKATILFGFLAGITMVLLDFLFAYLYESIGGAIYFLCPLYYLLNLPWTIAIIYRLQPHFMEKLLIDNEQRGKFQIIKSILVASLISFGLGFLGGLIFGFCNGFSRAMYNRPLPDVFITVILIVGLILLMILSLWLFLLVMKTAFYLPAILLDKKSGIASIKYSLKLNKGYRNYMGTFFIFVFGFIIYTIVGFLLGIMAVALSLLIGHLWAIGVCCTLILWALVYPWFLSFFVCWYQNLKFRLEINEARQRNTKELDSGDVLQL